MTTFKNVSLSKRNKPTAFFKRTVSTGNFYKSPCSYETGFQLLICQPLYLSWAVPCCVQQCVERAKAAIISKADYFFSRSRVPFSLYLILCSILGNNVKNEAYVKRDIVGAHKGLYRWANLYPLNWNRQAGSLRHKCTRSALGPCPVSGDRYRVFAMSLFVVSHNFSCISFL